MATLRELLTRAQLLLGLTAPTQKPQSQTLVDVLSSRLDAYRQLDDTTTAQAVQQTDTQLQRQTAQAALDLLTAIAHLATKDFPSTSANHGPPLFGARDIKAIGMLAGVLGRWGVQADLEVAQQKPKIAEIEEEQEEDRRTRLLQTVRRIVEEVLQLDLAAAQPAQATRSDSSRQLVQLVLSQFLGPLTGALVELSAGKGDEGENGQKDWAGRALQGVVRRSVVASSPCASSFVGSSVTDAFYLPYISPIAISTAFSSRRNPYPVLFPSTLPSRSFSASRFTITTPPHPRPTHGQPPTSPGPLDASRPPLDPSPLALCRPPAHPPLLLTLFPAPPSQRRPLSPHRRHRCRSRTWRGGRGGRKESRDGQEVDERRAFEREGRAAGALSSSGLENVQKD